MLGRRDQAVLDAAETAQRLLVGSRVEEPDILRIARLQFREENGVRMRLGVVEIFAVAGQTAQEDALVLQVSGRVVMNEESIIYQFSRSFCCFWLTIE